MNIKHGLIEGVRYIPSPNYNDRPSEGKIDLVVLHGISLPPGEFGGPHIESFFTNQLDPWGHPYFQEIIDNQVSAHVVIYRTGEIVQFVPFHKRAWHAGKSHFQGRDDCNNYSIGIELEGTDDTFYTDLQYQQCAKLVKSLIVVYPSLNDERVVGHSDIAPGRKTDPGPHFDWEKLQDLCLRMP